MGTDSELIAAVDVPDSNYTHTYQWHQVGSKVNYGGTLVTELTGITLTYDAAPGRADTARRQKSTQRNNKNPPPHFAAGGGFEILSFLAVLYYSVYAPDYFCGFGAGGVAAWFKASVFVAVHYAESYELGDCVARV